MTKPWGRNDDTIVRWNSQGYIIPFATMCLFALRLDDAGLNLMLTSLSRLPLKVELGYGHNTMVVFGKTSSSQPHLSLLLLLLLLRSPCDPG